MAMDCEKAKRLLDSYHERQLRGRKFDNVSEHLRDCDGCAAELENLQRLSRALKERYASAVAGEVDFSQMWAGVNAAIGSERPAEPLLGRLIAVLSIPKPAWAVVAAAAILIVMVFAYMPGDRQAPVMAENDCVIDSVEAEDYSVMVYEIGDSQMKVIWVMDQQPEQDLPGENT